MACTRLLRLRIVVWASSRSRASWRSSCAMRRSCHSWSLASFWKCSCSALYSATRAALVAASALCRLIRSSMTASRSRRRSIWREKSCHASSLQIIDAADIASDIALSSAVEVRGGPQGGVHTTIVWSGNSAGVASAQLHYSVVHGPSSLGNPAPRLSRNRRTRSHGRLLLEGVGIDAAGGGEAYEAW